MRIPLQAPAFLFLAAAAAAAPAAAPADPDAAPLARCAARSARKTPPLAMDWLVVSEVERVSQAGLGETCAAFQDVLTAAERLGPGSRAAVVETVAAARDSLRRLIMTGTNPRESDARAVCALGLKREAFGAPISELEAIQFMFADMAIQIEAARLLVYQAGWLVDQGRFDRQDAHLLSAAKAFATEMAVRVSSDALQVLGAQGYMKDHPLERHYRDARQLMIVEGTSQIHRVIIARALLQRDLVYP